MRAAHSMVGLWVALCAATAAQAANTGRFGWLGLAPVEAGQTLTQAETVLGAALQGAASSAKDTKGCHLLSTPSQPGVAYVISQGVVTRIETRDTRYVTVRGVRVGDKVTKARKVYGQRLSVTPHVYFSRGFMLAVYSPDRKFALIMESNDSGRIITLRGGLVPAVEFLEGCSA